MPPFFEAEGAGVERGECGEDGNFWNWDGGTIGHAVQLHTQILL